MKVSLFATCLVDQLFPQVGVAAARLLRRLGLEVDYPMGQTCCGQPAFNSGFRNEARQLALRFIEVFEPSEAIVAPSGSCAAMVKVFYPELFDGGWRRRAEALGARVYELSQFLVERLGIEDLGSRYEARATYHDSCHLLRELKTHDAPRRLLRRVAGLELVELESSDICCGFGGLFSVKFPDLSTAIMNDKIEKIARSGAEVVVSCDMGCLMHLAGGIGRRGLPVKTLHLAEVLAGK